MTATLHPPRPRGGGFAGDALKLMSGTTAAQAIGILATPVLTRLYAPEAFGLVAVFGAVASLLGVIACLRYELAIPLPADDTDAAALLAAAIAFALIVATATALLLAGFGDSLLTLLNAPELIPLRGLLPLFVALTGIALACNYWNTRRRFFGRISLATLAGSAGMTAGKLGFGLTGRVTGGSLVLATVFGQLLTTLLLAGQTARSAAAPLRAGGLSLHRITAQIVRYRKFPLIDAGGALLNNASWQIPPLLFAAYFSPVVVGFYALAFRFIQLPMSLIGTALGQVFYPRIAAARSKGEPLGPLVLSFGQRLVALGLLPAALFGACGPDLFTIAFGARWTEAGGYAQLLSPWVFFWFVASPLSLVFNALERQGLLFGYHVLIFATRLAAIVIGARYENVRLALLLFSATGVLVYGALCITTLRLVAIPVTNALRSVLPHLLIALPLTAAVAATRAFGASPLAVTAAAALAAAAYAAAILARDHELHALARRTPRL
jgi:O-antigen/teichoic acid export membrane protein